MSKKYTTIELELVNEAQKAAVEAVLNEGALRERERILTFLEEERRIANEILAKEDCSSDCYKCDLIGGSTLGLVDRLTTFLNGEDNES